MADTMSFEGVLIELEQIEKQYSSRLAALGIHAVVQRVKAIIALAAKAEQEGQASRERLNTLTRTIEAKGQELAALEERLTERRQEIAAEERQLAQRESELRASLVGLEEDFTKAQAAHAARLSELDAVLARKRAELDQVYVKAHGIVEQIDRILGVGVTHDERRS